MRAIRGYSERFGTGGIRWAVLAFVLGLSTALPAAAVEFSGLYVFGDSLSDSGQFATPSVFSGTFTNPDLDADGNPVANPVYSQNLAAYLGLELSPSTLLPGNTPEEPANNYAVGGNRTDAILRSITSESVVDASTIINLPPGVLRQTRPGYLVENPRVDRNALYIVWGGGNDVRDGADPLAAADNIVESVKALRDAGAEFILVNNIPDIGAVPESGILGNRSLRAADSVAFTQRLDRDLSHLEGNIIRADIFGIFNELLADPTAYGYADVNHSNACYDANAVSGIVCREDPNFGINGSAADPTKLIFWDGIHATEVTHKKLSAYLQSIMEAPGLISTLSLVPLTAGRNHQRFLERQTENVDPIDSDSRWFPIVGGMVNGADADDTDEAAGYDEDGYELTAGVGYRFSQQLMGGLAFGWNDSDVDFDGNRGDFDFSGYYFSGFGGYRGERWFATGVLSYGDLDFDNIRRKIDICDGCRVEKGDTDGHQWALRGSVGLDLLAQEATSLGPVISLRYQNVKVGGYTEKGETRSTTLRFARQRRESFIGSIGVFALHRFQAPWGGLALSGTLAREHNFSGDEEDIRASVDSFDGKGFKLAGIPLENDAWTAVLGAVTQLTPRTRLNVTYSYRKGDDFLDEQSLSVGFAIDL